MTIVYLAHPVAAPTVDGVAANLARAKRWILWIYRNYPDVAVVANWLIDCEILNDANPADREAGLARDEAIICRCDELWLVGGRISTGMARELAAALSVSINVFDFTRLGPEPPNGPVADIDRLWMKPDDSPQEF